MLRLAVWLVVLVLVGVGTAAAADLDETRGTVPERPPTRGYRAGTEASLEATRTVVYRAGEMTDFRIVLDAPLAEGYAALRRGEPDQVLAALAAHAAGGDSAVHWLAQSLRFLALLQSSRAADAEQLAEDLAPLARKFTGGDWSARALRGTARVQLADYAGALDDLGQVARTIGGWSLPVEYMSVPSDIVEMKMKSEAQLLAYTGIATVFARRGEFARALVWAEAAEDLYQDVYYVLLNPHYGFGNGGVLLEAAIFRAYNMATLGLARAMTRRGDPSGKAALEAAGRFFAAHRHAHGQVVVLAYQADAAIQDGRLDEALALARRGETLAAESGMGDNVWMFAALRGEIELRASRGEQAEAAYRSAQNGVEQAIGSLASETSRTRFGAGKERIARRLVEFDLARGDHAALFRDLERSRAMSFVDMLSGLPLASGRQSERVAAIRAADRRIALQRLKNGTPGAPAGGGAVEAELLAERQRLVGELRRHDAELADTLSVASANLAAVQERLGPGEALAYALPAASGQPLPFLLVDRGGSRIVHAATDEIGFGRLLVDLRKAVVADGERARALAAEVAAALRLADWNVKAGLYVVPRGIVYFVPWGALDVGYPVAVVPLGGWVARAPLAVNAAKAAVVVGDPDFAGRYPQLPAARKEAEEVGSLYGAAPLVGAVATEAALRREVGAGTGVLHIATHAFFDAQRPLASGLALSGAGRPEMLTAARLVEQPLPARLVVLSGCDTGLASFGVGDDFLGLPRSFYLGGAVAVMSSLWPVDDEGTKTFMRTFHEQARAGNYGAGWLAARNRLKAAGVPPFVYGAFVLGGALHE